jgi:NAD-dependent dihydropyrimidine dehydrogenase PreA subunit
MAGRSCEAHTEAKSMNDCKGPGMLVPVINRNKCEGKNDCVEVCPTHVFELGVLDAAQRRELSAPGRIKSFFHGYKQAFVVHPEACAACGLCVTACPEKAITLRRTT